MFYAAVEQESQTPEVFLGSFLTPLLGFRKIELVALKRKADSMRKISAIDRNDFYKIVLDYAVAGGKDNGDTYYIAIDSLNLFMLYFPHARKEVCTRVRKIITPKPSNIVYSSSTDACARTVAAAIAAAEEDDHENEKSDRISACSFYVQAPLTFFLFAPLNE